MAIRILWLFNGMDRGTGTILSGRRAFNGGGTLSCEVILKKFLVRHIGFETARQVMIQCSI